MTKFLAALLVLLHLCFSVQANRDIHLEMVKGLEKLNLLYRQNKTNVSLPTTMNVPSPKMQKNPTKCVGVFVKELKSILSNVTVYNDDRDTLTGIQNILQTMEDQLPAADGQEGSQQRHKDGRACLMTPWTMNSMMPFKQFIIFLKDLSKIHH